MTVVTTQMFDRPSNLPDYVPESRFPSFNNNSQYLGQVATRSNIPSLLNVAYQQIGSRRFHIARDDISSLQIAFPNWISNNTVNEAGSGGTAVFTASIEYPLNTFTQVKWSGSATSPTVADGTTSPLSDPVSVSIPNGATFWIRVYGQFSVAVVFNSLANSAYSAGGDKIEYAASSITDKTMGGTIATGSTGLTFGACLILAQTKRSSFLILGDSRNKGGASSPGVDTADASGDLGETARSIGAGFGYINCGTASESQQSFLTNNSRRTAFGKYVSHVINNGSINDLINNRTALQLQADVAAVAALFPRPTYIQTTIGPRTTSTDGWTTLANQTVTSLEAQRVAYNTVLRNGQIPGVNKVADVADAIESSRNSGLIAVGPGATSYSPDGLHWVQSGCLAIAASKTLNAQDYIR